MYSSFPTSGVFVLSSNVCLFTLPWPIPMIDIQGFSVILHVSPDLVPVRPMPSQPTGGSGAGLPARNHIGALCGDYRGMF